MIKNHELLDNKCLKIQEFTLLWAVAKLQESQAYRRDTLTQLNKVGLDDTERSRELKLGR